MWQPAWISRPRCALHNRDFHGLGYAWAHEDCDDACRLRSLLGAQLSLPRAGAQCPRGGSNPVPTVWTGRRCRPRDCHGSLAPLGPPRNLHAPGRTPGHESGCHPEPERSGGEGSHGHRTASMGSFGRRRLPQDDRGSGTFRTMTGCPPGTVAPLLVAPHICMVCVAADACIGRRAGVRSIDARRPRRTLRLSEAWHHFEVAEGIVARSSAAASSWLRRAAAF